MTEAVAIVGPSSPKTLSRWLNASDQRIASDLRGLGGSCVNNLVEALLGAGALVELITLAPELTENITFEGPRLRILAGPYRVCPRLRAQDFFRAERRHVADLVADTTAPVAHAQWTYEFALGTLASSARPTVVTAHDAPLTILRHAPDIYRAVRTTMAIATRLRVSLLAVSSPYLAAAWKRQMLYRRPMPIVPNVVLSAVNTANRGKPDRARLTILDVTEGGRAKNAPTLVRAMPQVLSSYPEARLRLVGPGLTNNSPMRQLAENLGVREAIEFVGPLESDRLNEEYSRATIFVHASLEESFGMTVAEAMSHGLPVVAGAGAGAVPWVLDEGRAGLLVDTRRPEAVARAICCLLEDPELRAKLGRTAAQRARSMFSPEVVAMTALQLYDDVAKNHIKTTRDSHSI